MKTIEIDTVVFPLKEIRAICPTCKTELKRVSWTSLSEHQRKKREIEKSVSKCQFCGERFLENNAKAKIPWERTSCGDYIAKAKNGDFLIWKYGYGWKYRYRAYGAENPDFIAWKRTKDEAIKACERHAEWKL